MQWLIPLATAVWAFLRWSHERELDRARERERMGSLYVNPFLSACEDLQSRIYNILELGGFRVLRKRYPDGTYAEETLYLVVRFFWWLATVLRYSPYPQDTEVIRISEAVRNAFAVSAYPVGPFTFFRPEQKALGKIVMTRFKGQHGIELDTISFYELKKRLEEPPLCDSESLKQSLKALRNARTARSLQGRERLAEAQRHLVDLLSHEEARLGLNRLSERIPRCLQRG